MNSIEVLKREVERALPGVETRLRKPRKESGSWWLDSKHNGHLVAVEWSPRRGFGISTGDPEDGYGEGPDEVLVEREAAVKRVVDLLVRGTRSVPPPDVLLRELRAALGFTQEQLATRLGVQQAAVSRLERRPDITLRSLRRYVEALGGELEINVRTPDGEQLKLLDEGKAKARAACAHASQRLQCSDSALAEPPIGRLTEMLTWLEGAARSRWALCTRNSLALVSAPTTPLAAADTANGCLSINLLAVAQLADCFSKVASTVCSEPVSAEPACDAVYRFVLAHEIGHLVRPDEVLTPGASLTNPELRADTVAGWLAALAGDEPSVGSTVAGLLGCRRSGCSHPTPEQRTLAFLSGHSRALTARKRAPSCMNLLVLRVANLDASRSFYAGLGLDLIPERHGQGPLHYACTIGGMVIELYPSTRAHPPNGKLRFGLQATRGALDWLCSSGQLNAAPTMIRSLPRSEVYLLRDPDANAVEIEVATSDQAHGKHAG